MKSLLNKIIEVTGAASGMGEATARYLAKQGAKIALLDINVEKANDIALEIGGMAYQCDVTSENSANQVATQIMQNQGKISALINCAGIAPAKRIIGREGAMPLSDFSKVIEINLIGTFNMMRAIANLISQNQLDTDSAERGVIINTASVAGFEGQIGQAAYSASKAGIIGMTLPAARELARFGIRVMTIAPGIMKTPMLAAMPDDVQNSLAQMMPFPKRLGQPEEFARLVQHILENEYLNGEVIRLDAGIRMTA